MKYSRATVGKLQLDDYVAVVPGIYSVHDEHRSIWDVWCHVLHHAAAVIERIRKDTPEDELVTEIADLALWLFTTVHKIAEGIGESSRPGKTPESVVRIRSSCSDLLWHRYPGMCHMCYSRRSKGYRIGPKNFRPFARCDCEVHYKDSRDKNTKRHDSAALRSFSEANVAKKPKTIEEWQQMFGIVFGASITRYSLVDIAVHLMEEMGETSDALVRMYSYTKKSFRPGEPNWREARLESQIADVFSWLFAIVCKLNESQRGITMQRRHSKTKTAIAKPVTLAEIIWQRYGSDRLHSFYCPVCKTRVCSCELIFIPATRPVEDFLKRFQPPPIKAIKERHKYRRGTK